MPTECLANAEVVASSTPQEVMSSRVTTCFRRATGILGVARIYQSSCVVDNHVAPRRRYHVHYTPTYSSWLNQVEIWFNIITQRAIRRGTFRSVKALIIKINQFVENYNSKTRPFVWTATADSILNYRGTSYLFCLTQAGG